MSTGRNEAGAVPPGIAGEMAASGGRVTFARFMELALTHPTEGYYSGAGRILGRRGHFSTAPTLSADFNETVARLVTELVDAMGPAASVVELGGGEGELAKAILERLRGEQPSHRRRTSYTIVEVGQQLRARQRKALARAISDGRQVSWAHDLAAALQPDTPTVVVGNEFVDALPVHVVQVRGQVTGEAWVQMRKDEGSGVEEVWGPLSAEAAAELRALLGATDAATLRPLSRDGYIEVRPLAGRLLRELKATETPACLLTVDYGDWFGGPARDVRGRGAAGTAADTPVRGAAVIGAGPEVACEPAPYGRTLRGYFRHQLTRDPYARVGRQDLTADVDFRALDVHGRLAGFETVLYTTVAGMLLGDRGPEKLERLRSGAATSLDMDRRATVLQGLLDYEGVGGAFKVMLQVRE